jgi:hypothetical protein
MGKKAEYKWVGNHPQDFPGGRTLAVGEVIMLDDEALKHHLVEDLLAQGTLVSTAEPKTEGGKSS